MPYNGIGAVTYDLSAATLLFGLAGGLIVLGAAAYGFFVLGRALGDRPARPGHTTLRLVGVGCGFALVVLLCTAALRRPVDRAFISLIGWFATAVPTGAGFLAGVDEYRRRVADAMHRRADRWLADWESERFGPTEIPDE